MGKLKIVPLIFLAWTAVAGSALTQAAWADDVADCPYVEPLHLSDIGSEGRLAVPAGAVSACRRLADKGDAHAQLSLGKMYDYGRGVPRDQTAAAMWYRKAADQGLAEAQFYLGTKYVFGLGVPQDGAAAVTWWSKAAEQGFGDAQFQLGLMYLFQGAPEDIAKAVTWLSRAADQGHHSSIRQLADMYYYGHANGHATPQDFAKAAKWYRKAAEQGDTTAQAILGDMCHDGQGVKKNYTEAAKWYRKPAEQGYAFAQLSLGDMYRDGQGVKKNYTEAAKWYRKAAEQGSPAAQFAQFDLALMYENGQGVQKSYAEAGKWYRESAEPGLAEAQNNLGVEYQFGMGVAKDYVQAYMWYNLAASAGNDKAAKNRDAIEKLMTSEQTAEAQRRTSEWKPRGSEVAATTPPPSPTAPPSTETASEVFGTGFFITKDGEALTNAHVVEGCSQPRILLAGQYVPTHIVARDALNDLALLKADVQPTEIAHFRLSARQGEDVEVYGFPLADLLSSSGNVTSGNVAALSGLADDTRFLQISAPVQPGNSGGPLFDQSGNVIGVVVGKLDALKIASITSDIPQNVNFAIKASVVASFLDSANVLYASGQRGERLSAADIAERARAFTVQIECQR